MALYRHKLTLNDSLRAVLSFSNRPRFSETRRPPWADSLHFEIYKATKAHEDDGEYLYEVDKKYLQKRFGTADIQLVGLEIRHVDLETMFATTEIANPIPAKELLVCTEDFSMKLVIPLEDLERIDKDE